MNHADHVRLIQNGVQAAGGIWADLGAGSGAFTLALAECLGGAGTLVAVDKNAAALRQNANAVAERFPAVDVQTRQADFTSLPDLPALDGIVMANALHYVRRKKQVALVAALRKRLKPDGRFIIVEYDTDRGNQWVPYPMRYATWEKMATEAGFTHTEKIGSQPSRFLGAFFSAVSWGAGNSA